MTALANGDLVGEKEGGWAAPAAWMHQDPDAKPSWDPDQAIRYWGEVKGAELSEDGW